LCFELSKSLSQFAATAGTERRQQSMPRTVALEDLDLGALIRPGEVVAWGQIAGEPSGLVEALAAQAPGLGGVAALVGLSLTESLKPESAEAIAIRALGGGATNHRLAAPGRLEVVPLRLSDLPHLIASGAVRVDVALVQVSADDGGFNLGISADYMGEALAAARLVIAEANAEMPRTFGDTRVGSEAVDLVVPTSRPLIVRPPAVPGAAERAIAGHVARLVPDRAVIQTGIGSVPDAVLAGLGGKKDLGVHSGLIGDGILDLIEAGVVSNASKEVDPGLTVTAALYGSERLYRWADRNSGLAVRSVRHTHAQEVMQHFRRFVSINSAIEVDLTGQVNSETVNGRHIGQIGGQIDFVRAGVRAPEGRSIIALPATARGGTVSRIVARLGDGVVTTARAEVDTVVTEHGIAELQGRSLSERAQALTAIAEPRFRAELERAAERLV
jgi:acyl-CoA hydrolase